MKGVKPVNRGGEPKAKSSLAKLGQRFRKPTKATPKACGLLFC